MKHAARVQAVQPGIARSMPTFCSGEKKMKIYYYMKSITHFSLPAQYDRREVTDDPCIGTYKNSFLFFPLVIISGDHFFSWPKTKRRTNLTLLIIKLYYLCVL